MSQPNTAASEPYGGVAALFNADLHAAAPQWAPREHWRILNPATIRYQPPTTYRTSNDCKEIHTMGVDTQGTPDGQRWWYLSFVGDNGWLGGCFVQAADHTDAVIKAHQAQCNPGGQVAGYGPLEVDIKPEHANRLLTLEEVENARLEGTSTP